MPTDEEKRQQKEALKAVNELLAWMIDRGLMCSVVTRFYEAGQPKRLTFVRVQSTDPAATTAVLLLEGVDSIRQKHSEGFTPREGLTPERN